MTVFSSTLRDQNQAPIAGAKVYVYTATGTLDALTNPVGGGPLANPLTSDEFGNFSFVPAADGAKTIDIFLGGVRVWKEVIAVGGSDIPTLTALAQPTGAGIVGATGGTTVQAALDARPTSASLVASGGAALVGSNDGAGGSLWTTIAGFVTYLRSSAGASIVNFIQSGVGAVQRTIAAKLGDVIHARDYGGTWDGVADDTTAAQNAINAGAAQGKTVVFPKLARIGAVTIPAGSHIIGPGFKCTLTAIAGSYDTFTLNGSDIRIDGFRHECAAKTGGYEYHINCGTSTFERLAIRNILTFDARGGLRDSGTTGYHITTELSHLQFRRHNGPGLFLRRAFAFNELPWVTVDFVGVSTSDFTGFDLDFAGLPAGSGGLEFRQCDVLGTAGTFNLANQHGFKVNGAAAVWFNHTRADALGGTGYILSNLNKCTFGQAEASLCAGPGAELTNVSNTRGDLSVFGRKGLGYAPANIDGIRFVSGCFNVKMSGGMVVDCTGHGIHKVAAQAGAINISGYMCIGNLLRGIKTVGNSAFLFSGGTLVGNTVGNYDLGGSSDYIRATQLNSGGVTDAGPGPVTA